MKSEVSSFLKEIIVNDTQLRVATKTYGCSEGAMKGDCHHDRITIDLSVFNHSTHSHQRLDTNSLF